LKIQLPDSGTSTFFSSIWTQSGTFGYQKGSFDGDVLSLHSIKYKISAVLIRLVSKHFMMPEGMPNLINTSCYVNTLTEVAHLRAVKEPGLERMLNGLTICF